MLLRQERKTIMKIGDMVIRAYAWSSIVPGIIVDEQSDILKDDEGNELYVQTNYIVQWSDGIQSTEMYEELDHLGPVLEMINDYKAKGDYRNMH